MRRLKSISIFILLAYALSWTVFLLLALNHHHKINLFPVTTTYWQLENIGHAAGGLGPVIAALVALFIFHDKERRKHYLQGYSFKKIKRIGWLLAFSPFLLFGICLLAGRIIHQQWFDISAYFVQNKLNDPFNLLAWFLPVLLYGFGEEAGWRGYLLPQLQAKNNAFMSTLIVTLFWLCWHLPTFFYRYQLKGGAYLGFSLGLFAGAIWLTFLFNYTKGSILAVSTWHFCFNLVSMLVKDDLVLSAIMSAMVMIVGGVILVKFDAESLSPVQRIAFNGIDAEEDQYKRKPYPKIVSTLPKGELHH
jgi:uncharacterized protein